MRCSARLPGRERVPSGPKGGCFVVLDVGLVFVMGCFRAAGPVFGFGSGVKAKAKVKVKVANVRSVWVWVWLAVELELAPSVIRHSPFAIRTKHRTPRARTKPSIPWISIAIAIASQTKLSQQCLGRITSFSLVISFGRPSVRPSSWVCFPVNFVARLKK